MPESRRQRLFPLALRRMALLSVVVWLAGCMTFEAGTEIQSGRNAFLRGDSNTALTHFQRVAESDPGYITNFGLLRQSVWTYLGKSYYSSGKYSEARQALEKAITNDNDDGLGRLYYGLTLIRQSGPLKSKTLSLDDLIYALREGVPPVRVGALARDRGIDFKLNRETETKLKSAGADDALLRSLNQMSEPGSNERGLKELEASLRRLQAWFDYNERNSPDGRFWDPGHEIRGEIQSTLSTIAAGKAGPEKILSNGERIGKKLEEEIDRSRSDRVKQKREGLRR